MLYLLGCNGARRSETWAYKKVWNWFCQGLDSKHLRPLPLPSPSPASRAQSAVIGWRTFVRWCDRSRVVSHCGPMADAGRSFPHIHVSQLNWQTLPDSVTLIIWLHCYFGGRDYSLKGFSVYRRISCNHRVNPSLHGSETFPAVDFKSFDPDLFGVCSWIAARNVIHCFAMRPFWIIWWNSTGFPSAKDGPM